MTPDDSGFYDILHSQLPRSANSNENCYTVNSVSGVMQAVSFEAAIEYALGGEMDECQFGDGIDGLESDCTNGNPSAGDDDCDDTERFIESLDWLQSTKPSDWQNMAESWKCASNCG
jgi:hypothetical protein